MREKLFNILNKIYGILMFVGFFAGFIPFIPYVIAIIVGGEFGESITLFLYNQYYPIVFVIVSIAVLIGVIAMYVNKKEGFSLKELENK